MKNLILCAAILASTNFVFAKADKVIDISDARIFAPMKGSNATGGYVTFKNITKCPAVIMLKSAVPFKAVEMHETVHKDGRMAMQKIEQLSVDAGKSFELKPGAHHMMFFDATKEVKAGDTVQVTFLINGTEEKVDFKVVDRAAQKDEATHH